MMPPPFPPSDPSPHPGGNPAPPGAWSEEAAAPRACRQDGLGQSPFDGAGGAAIARHAPPGPKRRAGARERGLDFGADKFCPSRVESLQFFVRERIVSEILRRCASRNQNILLEAQAGQGKTTLIKQLLSRMDTASAWYQVGPEDADPAFFLAGIQACVACSFPEAMPAAGASDLPGGDTAIFDLPERIDLLLGDLRAGSTGERCLVFDDLHNLAGHESSLFILDQLMENAPAGLRFILSSREPLPLDAWRPSAGKLQPVRIGNRDLAMNQREVADFCHGVFDLNLPSSVVQEITATTDGWMMGVLLIGRRMAHVRGGDAPDGSLGMGRKDVKDYFRHTVFAALEPRLHEPLVTLSLLEDIPVELARGLTAQPRIGDDLARLARRNVFIRPLDSDSASYALHHLFRQFLREKAHKDLGSEARRQAYRQAGQFFAARGNPSKAMRYLLQGGDFQAIEAVLRQGGMALLAANQTATLASILEQIPGPEMARLGWAPFYLALAHLDFAPTRVLPLLFQALAHFTGRQDGYGELLCLAHIIAIHITTTGHYREGVDMLARAEALFAELADGLDASTTVLLAGNLAMGRGIFLADIPAATRYASLGLELARKEGLVNFEAVLIMIMGYVQIFAGRLSGARPWLEQASAFLGRPEVGAFNCLAIRMMLFNHLFHDGDFANYFDQKNQLVTAIGQDVVSQSIAGPFCYIWEMDIALGQGRFEDALGLAEQVLAMEPPPSPHMRGLALQLKAIALALTGQPGPALAAAEESTRLREQAGGMYFITLNKLLCGLTHGLCRNHREGLALLTESIGYARKMPTEYLEACALMHRGALHLACEDQARAREDIESALRLMRRNAYRSFWAWTPKAAEEALGFAAANRLEIACARDLAATRVDADLREDGTVVPRIECKLLGGCSILLRGVPLLNIEDLTPAQRELLCLLVASPGLKMVQERAQLHFWPDSTPAATKANLDTLLARLRKAMSQAFPDETPNRYLNRDKGVIWLEHCRVDALDFLDLANGGLEHCRAREYWQAGNCFARADALWQGEFAPGVTGEDLVRDFRQTLAKSLTRMALAWCPLLVEGNRSQKALDIAEKALRADSLNDSLWGLLYRLHAQKSSLSARQVLDRFARSLRAEEYPEHEVQALVRAVEGHGRDAGAGAVRAARRVPGLSG